MYISNVEIPFFTINRHKLNTGNCFIITTIVKGLNKRKYSVQSFKGTTVS